MFKVGVAEADITPAKKAFLAGFGLNRISEGVHDRLRIRCLILDNGKKAVVLIVADLIGLMRDFVLEVKSMIRRSMGIPSENVIICCTHTHSGPDTIGLWGPRPDISGVDEEYMRVLMKSFVRVVKGSLSNRKRAMIKHSRAWIDPIGIVKNARNPGLVDRYLAVLHIVDGQGNTLATLVNFACHPEVLDGKNKMITSDYPHFLRRFIEKKLGGLALFFNGPLGGMLTPDVKERSFGEAKRVGESIGTRVLEAIHSEREVKGETIEVRRAKVRIPLENRRFYEAWKRGVLKRRLENCYIITEVALIEIGDEVSLIALPGEPLPRLGMELRSVMYGKSRFILCLADDEIGYIIPDDLWNPRAYEESMSVGPSAASKIMEAAERLIEDQV